jgi:hypothetical protein
MKTCRNCGGAVLTGITGWGGAICMCVYPETKEPIQITTDNSQVNLNLLAENKRLKAELEAMKNSNEDLLRRCHTIGNIALRWMPEMVRKGGSIDGYWTPNGTAILKDREKIVSILAKNDEAIRKLKVGE